MTDSQDVQYSVNGGYSTCCNELIVPWCDHDEDGCSHDQRTIIARQIDHPFAGFLHVHVDDTSPRGLRKSPSTRIRRGDWKTLAAVIRQRREELGLSRAAVARLLVAELPNAPITLTGARVSQNEAGLGWKEHPYLVKAYATVLVIPRPMIVRLLPQRAPTGDPH